MDLLYAARYPLLPMLGGLRGGFKLSRGVVWILELSLPEKYFLFFRWFFEPLEPLESEMGRSYAGHYFSPWLGALPYRLGFGFCPDFYIKKIIFVFSSSSSLTLQDLTLRKNFFRVMGVISRITTCGEFPRVLGPLCGYLALVTAQEFN